MNVTGFVPETGDISRVRPGRWRPSRAGLVNVWRYLEETFEFHGGRLLLRGPNGSGKSMALELLFPFLLDASALPTRLSSAAKSRGGLYDRIMAGGETPTRIGYAWGEFLRETEAGDEAFTIGVRLRGSTASAKATTDWFTTSLRVGRDLTLLDENRSALSKKQLSEAIGERGTLYASAEDYRAAVRLHLFPGYGEKQYDAVITALLALRREKLSQDLTPPRLSEILTASLPSVDEHDIAEIAEGFEKLDRRRDEIAALERDRDQIRRLVARRRSYARAVMHTRANAVRGAETRRDDVTKRERRARAELEEARAGAARVEAEERAAGERVQAIDAETDTLEHLEAYRAGAALGSLRDELARLDEQVRDATRSVERRELAGAADRAGLERRHEEVGTTERNEALARRELDEVADRIAGAGTVEGAAAEPDADTARTFLEAWSESRRRQLHEVRTAALEHERAINERRFHEDRLEEDRAENDRAVERRIASERALEEARDAYAIAVRDWTGGCTVLDREVLTGRLPAPPNEPETVRDVVDRMASELRQALAVSRADLERRLEVAAEERSGLEDERALLAGGGAIEPEAPAWRSARGEDAVPLWRLVDFREDCPEDLRGGVEAALLASGLLDALVAPDGRAELPDERADLLFDGAAEPVGGPSLADVLEPVEDLAVPSEVTARLLRSVALGPPSPGEPGASVAPNGTFGLAVLTGRGRTERPRFIGAAARERHRARRIGEIDHALATLARHTAGLQAGIDDADRETAALEAEVASLPDGSSLADWILGLERARSAAGASEDRVDASELSLREAEARVREAQRRLAVLAARHGMPTDEGALTEHAGALDRFDRTAAAWVSRRREHTRAREAVADAEQRVEERTADLREARRALDTQERQAREVRARLEALEQSAGAEYHVIASQLMALAAERQEIEERKRRLGEARVELARRTGRLEGDLEAAERERAQAEADRDEAHRALLDAVSEGIAGDADTRIDPAGLEGVSAVLETARALAQRLSDTQADQRSMERLHAHVLESLHACRQTLAGRVDLSLEQSERGWWLLRALAGGIRRSVGEYAAALEADLEAARSELKDEEHRLFDETLTGSVREAVAERIRRSNDLVERINGELSRVRTHAAGVQVRLRWEVDPEQPDAVRSARRLLLKDPADLAESEHDALYQFFRARIEQVRMELESATGWEDRLRAVLDYRTWHRFVLEIAHRDWEGFVPATSARIQRLSTGERSLALHLPMLASISAHYAGGSNGHESGCPRLILLDELFAGVDVANRAQLFELLVTWDLDAVLTSDHEWCAYATLDAIAIHHLHADGDEPVTSSRFTWDGRGRVPAPVGG